MLSPWELWCAEPALGTRDDYGKTVGCCWTEVYLWCFSWLDFFLNSKNSSICSHGWFLKQEMVALRWILNAAPSINLEKIFLYELFLYSFESVLCTSLALPRHSGSSYEWRRLAACLSNNVWGLIVHDRSMIWLYIQYCNFIFMLKEYNERWKWRKLYTFFVSSSLPAISAFTSEYISIQSNAYIFLIDEVRHFNLW